MSDKPTIEDYARARDTFDFLVGLVETEALARRQPRPAGNAIPVTIVAGFLGAGKTTLIRHLLTARHGLQVAALINDFASLNIDAALVEDVSQDTVQLTNGCICCSQSGGAARALMEVVSRPQPPDFILIETSGIADPWALAQVANNVPGIILDSIVTVVDAANFDPDPAVAFLLRRQISAADIVLVNKIDSIPNSVTDDVAHAIEKLAPKAQLLRTIHAAIPHCLIFDRASAELHTGLDKIPPAEHGNNFSAIALTATVPLDRTAVEHCLVTLPNGVFRAKGFLHLSDNILGPELLQAVGRRWTWDFATDKSPNSHLVVIGLTESVDEGRIKKHFAPAKLL